MVRKCKKIEPGTKITIEKELDKAYFAGLFDGEGSFTIRVDRRKSPPEFSSLVRIFMSDEPVIKEIADLIGYLHIPIKRTRKGKKLRTMYGITISIEDDVRDFLSQLHPYLKVKKQQAQKILELISLKANLGYERTKEIALKELKLWKEVAELNPRGKPPTNEQCNKLLTKINESLR